MRWGSSGGTGACPMASGSCTMRMAMTGMGAFTINPIAKILRGLREEYRGLEKYREG